MKYSLSSYRFFIIVLLLLFGRMSAQFITVDNSTYTPQQLVADKFIGTQNLSCVSISNVTVSGGNLGAGNSSYGYFNKGTSNLGMNEGIILSTGNILAAPGPKTKPVQSATASGWTGDLDLADATGLPMSVLSNATFLEFDFKSTLSKKISFRYMFLSEEYYPGNYTYSDAFAFLIKKKGSTGPYQNIAVVPGTGDPVSVTTINDRDNPKYFDGFIGFYSQQNGSNDSATNFNGQTKILTAVAEIDPGEDYHIKLVIADEGKYANSQYDSAVFLEAGSFVGVKDLGPDLTLENRTALCTLGSYTINATSVDAVNYTWYRDGIQIKSGNFPTYTVDYSDPGYYEVEIDLSGGCKLKGHITIEQQILPDVRNTVFNDVCDDDLDGNTEVYLNLYTSQIINNLSPDYNYDIRYYDNSPIDINNPTESPITKLEFSGDTKTIYLWVKPGQCDPVLTPITFNKNTLSQFHISVSAKTFEVCDDELKGKKEVVISSPDFINQLIPAGYDGSLSFYKTIAGAKSKDSNQFLGNNPTITLDAKQPLQTYYVRFHQLGACDNVAPISFEFKQPKESTVLKDTLICRGTYTDLDAGAGFTSYHWSNGENTQSIKNVPAGDYWVDLSFNDCVYRQFVKVSEPAELLIDNVLIEGNKITIQVSNGIPPYRYFLDGAQQSSNMIENVATGKHTVEVRDQCGFVIQNFSIIAIKNLITPNGDGFNDIIDYSDLMTKTDPVLEVYDRNGQLVFKGSPVNRFSWDGKLNGRDLPTSSYWYILEWNESGNPIRVKNTGWILLKNRNSY